MTSPADVGNATHLYLAHVRVRHHQLDPLGHVNNAAYLNFLEQAAIDHTAAGYDVARLANRPVVQSIPVVPHRVRTTNHVPPR